MVQAEHTKEIGWLILSTRNMGAGSLLDAISTQLGIVIGLQRKVIPTGKSNVIAESDKVLSLSIGCDH